MKNYVNYFASVGINALIVFLYVKLLLTHDGIQGLAAIYALAVIISILLYIFRKKTIQIDAIMGGACLLGMLYVLIYKKSWYLMAEMLMTLLVIFSVTYYYLDWKSLDKRSRGKKLDEET